jgi:calcium/calmodulin-dependent 3',5'-cyclic nucleotide phosphodiesterase
LTNEYYFNDEVRQLGEFLIVTVRQARVQIFSPLSISTMVQEIGISFLRCSKYLMIEKYMKLIRENDYKIEKLSGHRYIYIYRLIYNSFTDHQSPLQQTTQNRITFSLEDSNSIYITMIGLDFNKKQDFSLYREFQQNYNKYLKFVSNCVNKTAYHKFFLKSGESIIFEFSKKGQLTFLSKCIP